MRDGDLRYRYMVKTGDNMVWEHGAEIARALPSLTGIRP